LLANGLLLINLIRYEWQQLVLQESGLDVRSYDRQWRQYMVRLTGDDVEKHKSLLTEFMKNA
jgi:hypothetical protein